MDAGADVKTVNLVCLALYTSVFQYCVLLREHKLKYKKQRRPGIDECMVVQLLYCVVMFCCVLFLTQPGYSPDVFDDLGSTAVDSLPPVEMPDIPDFTD